MKTEKEFLAELDQLFYMTEKEESLAMQAIIDMTAGNPIMAMRTGIGIAEDTIRRVKRAIEERKKEVDNAG